MTRNHILLTLKEIINSIFPNQNIKLDEAKNLSFDLGLSSLEIILFALEIEKEYNIEFKSYPKETFEKVKNVIDYILEFKNEK